MPKLVTYRCPDCAGEFDFLHHPADEPPPERCELCGSYMGDEPQSAPVLHLNFGKPKNAVPDQLYRRMEDSSKARAEEAAEMTGASVSEMSAVKITDMKDNTRAGDTFNIDNASAAARRLSTAAAKPELQNPQAAQWAGETTAGPEALTTRTMMDKMPHRNLIAEHTRAGNDGKRY